MASLYKKVIHGHPYWYLRQMGWVDGKPKMISERYVGTAAEVEALLDAREQAILPERTRHLDFGAVAAVWGLLEELGVAGLIDDAVGPGPTASSMRPATPNSSSSPQTAATAPKSRCRVRSGSIACSRASSNASTSAAVPTYRSEIIFGFPSTQPIWRRYQYGWP